MRKFKWHCGYGTLVDDVYVKFEVLAPTIVDAWNKAYKIMESSNVADTGSLDMSMDTTELAEALGNLASENYEPWVPTALVADLEKAKECTELISTLEWIVCNANKAKEVDYD